MKKRKLGGDVVNWIEKALDNGNGNHHAGDMSQVLPPEIHSTPFTSSAPACRVCGQGTLQKRKKYRMSGPVVVIGFLLLIPSVLGMLFGGLMLVSTGVGAAEVGSQSSSEAKQALISAGLSEPTAEKALNNKLSATEESALSETQRKAVSEAKLQSAAGTIGVGAAAAVGAGVALFFIAVSFVGGLLGWLLVMKKKVLQCMSCEATVAAS